MHAPLVRTLALIWLTSCAAPSRTVTASPEHDPDLAPESDGAPLRDEQSADEVCAGGAGDMCSALADHTFSRAKTAEQKERALAYAVKGCELKDGAGCSISGWAYEWGKAGAVDVKRALEAYGAGCRLDDGVSCVKAASLLAFGPLALRDRVRARDFAGRACTKARDERGCALEAKLKTEPAASKKNECAKKGVGTLSKAELKEVIQWHSPEVRDCFDRALQKTPTLAGRLELSWTVDCTGAVSKPTIAESSLPAHVGECVLGNVKTWRFPAPKGGGAVSVSFPWVLKPTSSSP